MNKSLSFLIFITMLIATIPSHAVLAVNVGARVLHNDNYEFPQGKSIGLITNYSAVVDGSHLADLVYVSGKVRLAALFAPEHGLCGLKEDGRGNISSGKMDSIEWPVQNA